MERRTFLGLGLTVAGTLLVDACSGGGKTSSAGGTTHPGGGTTGSAGGDLVLVPNDWEFFSGVDYRLALLLASTKNNGAPIPLDAPVSIRVGANGSPLGPPMPMVVHADGTEPAYAVTTYRFDRPGVYNLEATFKGQVATLPISAVDPSASPNPVVGQRLLSVSTPTVANPQGVNPVCTAQPACPFHAVSLDAALAQHRQIALLFATPALCQSRFCGPVLANLQSVGAPWAPTVTFIHCEIYTDLSGATTTNPVMAFKLEHEPMLYLAGADGIIKTRIDNLVDRGEVRDALTKAFGPPPAPAS